MKPRSQTARAWACTLRAAAILRTRLVELGGSEHCDSELRPQAQFCIRFSLPQLGRLEFYLIERASHPSNVICLFGKFLTATPQQLSSLTYLGVSASTGSWNHYISLVRPEVERMLNRLSTQVLALTGEPYAQAEERFSEPQW